MILNNTVVHHRNASKIQPWEVIPVEINWGCTKFGPFHPMVYSTYHHFPFQPSKIGGKTNSIDSSEESNIIDT